MLSRLSIFIYGECSASLMARQKLSKEQKEVLLIKRKFKEDNYAKLWSINFECPKSCHGRNWTGYEDSQCKQRCYIISVFNSSVNLVLACKVSAGLSVAI